MTVDLQGVTPPDGATLSIRIDLTAQVNVNVGHHLPFQQEFTMGGAEAVFQKALGLLDIRRRVLLEQRADGLHRYRRRHFAAQMATHAVGQQ